MFEQKVVGSEDLRFAASLAFVFSCIRLAAALLMAAGEAKSRIVERCHPALDGVGNTIGGD